MCKIINLFFTIKGNTNSFKFTRGQCSSAEIVDSETKSVQHGSSCRSTDTFYFSYVGETSFHITSTLVNVID